MCHDSSLFLKFRKVDNLSSCEPSNNALTMCDSYFTGPWGGAEIGHLNWEKKTSEYDQGTPQQHTADQHTAPRGRAAT